MSLPAILKELTLPIVSAPMFLVSGPELVIAQCKAGIVGSFPSLNARTELILDEWLNRIKSELQLFFDKNPQRKIAPFAVNLVVHPTNKRLENDLNICVKHEVPIVITSLHSPERVVEAVHSYGGLVFHDVTTVKHAARAAKAGVDGLILVCAGAGGHAGRLSPFALVPEVRRIFDGTIVLSGAIASGQAILALQTLGADLAYIGTRFIATCEANASLVYQQDIVASSADDIVYTDFFSGVHGSFLRSSITRAGLDPNDLFTSQKAEVNFNKSGGKGKAWRDVWSAGQGVGQIDSVEPVAELIDYLRKEYEESRAQWRATSCLSGE